MSVAAGPIMVIPVGVEDVSLVACLAALLWHARGTPLGEPFADDFLFLERVRLGGPHTWLDGGGSPL